MLEMMQGDQYRIPLSLTYEDGAPVTPNELKDLEVFIGSVRKTLADGGVSFEEGEGQFYVYITQEDTFKLRGDVKIQVRPLVASGEVVGINLETANVKIAASKVVLK